MPMISERRLDVVRPAVRIAVKHFGVLCSGDHARHVFDVGERIQDRLGRGVEDELP